MQYTFDQFGNAVPVFDPLTYHALVGMVGSTTGSPLDRKRAALALRLARQEGPDMYTAVMEHVMAARAEWRVWLTVTQRKWQTNVSRRPARGRHHDSWAIRERAVRCSNGNGKAG